MTTMQTGPRQPAPRTISVRMLIAYRDTKYEAGGIEVRIGRRAPAMDRLLTSYGEREAVLMTAWNPFSRLMPPGWNRRMQTRLARALGRRIALPATGTLRRWSEAHLLVFGNTVPIRQLARRFRQNSIVIIRLRQPVRLHCLAA